MFDLFCDARSSPPRVAAVLLDVGGALQFADLPIGDEILSQFDERNDGQIIALELLAILFGLGTFEGTLRGAYVRIWTDNHVAESNLMKGASKAEDLNMLVHGVWLLAAQMSVGVHIGRVPSVENLSDLPSREKYDLLINRLGAVRVEPVLHPLAQCVSKWELVGSHSLSAWPSGH